MSSCDIDHSVSSVQQKLAEQKEFLPTDLYEGSEKLLEVSGDQHTLNELFHFLKKYDLATEEVREERNRGIKELISN